MVAIHRSLYTLVLAASLSPLACAGEYDGAGVADHHDDGHEAGEGTIGTVSSALAANATVAQAVAAPDCATVIVKGLSVQLVEEVQCLRPNTFMKIDKTPGLALGGSVFPYLQTNAAKGLVAAQKARGVTMSINSAVRTLAQQYLLYRWYQTGRCGIGLAASPGTSNHEGAIAIDINDNAAWRTALQGKGFKWLGANDPVHYDFVAGGTVDLKGLSVTAFQRLWNRNNPTDLIAEDGDYGPATAQRLASAPAAGFAKGASCPKPAADAGADASAPADPDGAAPSDTPIIPDATDDGSDTPAAAPAAGAGLGPTSRPEPESTGCAISAAGLVTSTSTGGGAAALGLALAGAAIVASRRRRTAR